MLIDICRKCPKRSSCTALCLEIEALIPRNIPNRVDKYSKEIPASDLLVKENRRRETSEKEGLTEYEFFDYISGINTAAGLASDSDLNVQWRKRSLTDLEEDLPWEDFKIFKTTVHILVRDPIQKNRLKAFFACATLARIAQRSNTSKQNIQKQMARICAGITKKLSMEGTSVPLRIHTPQELKTWYKKLKAAATP